MYAHNFSLYEQLDFRSLGIISILTRTWLYPLRTLRKDASDLTEVPHQKGGTIQNKSRVGRFSARPFNLGIIYSCIILPRTHSQITPTATMSSEDHVKNIAIVGVSVTVKPYNICTESDSFRQAAEWAVRCLRAFCNAVPST